MLKLISINIQGDMNHGTVLPFLLSEKADVVCMQELFEEDIKTYEEALGMKCFFKSMMYMHSFKDANDIERPFGPAIFTNHKAEFFYEYIIGDESNIPVFAKPADSYTQRNISNIVLLWADITDKDGVVYRISTTHFTLTPDGLSTPYQIEDAEKLINVLDNKVKDFVVVGDFNTPREFETFKILADKYKDNIPLEYDSSLDPKLHRIPGLLRMVDVAFSTPEYKISNVKLVEGVSDHKAIVAYIENVK